MRHALSAALAGLLAAAPAVVTAEDHVLTRDAVVALARSRAPRILAARARIDEARGRLVEASALFAANPVVEVAAGPRHAPGGHSTDVEASMRQDLELFGTRSARIAGAEAALASAAARSDEAVRGVLRDAMRGFLRALEAAEELRLARDAEEMSAEMTRIADRRHDAGEVPILDVNAARASEARARAGVAEAEAKREEAGGALRRLLGFPFGDAPRIDGDLRDGLRDHSAEELLARLDERPDLRARRSEIEEAEAGARLGSALRWPAIGVGATWAQEEDAEIVLGEASVSLPLFRRGQAERLGAAARARRLRLELEAAREAARSAVRTGIEAYRRRVEAVRVLERDALPLLEENEELARRSYEAGERPLADWILARREALETRAEYLDRLLEAALAAVELEAAAGVLR